MILVEEDWLGRESVVVVVRGGVGRERVGTGGGGGGGGGVREARGMTLKPLTDNWPTSRSWQHKNRTLISTCLD